MSTKCSTNYVGRSCRRKLITVFLLVFFNIVSVSAVFAADTASFIDMGFSPDGLTYLFAQYGEVRKSATAFNGYAELYGINTAKNDFVFGGSQKSGPSFKTAGKTGSVVFEELAIDKDDFISKYGIKSESNSVVLYQNVPGSVSGDSADGTYIEFRDFENVESGFSYSVSLVELSEGSGTAIQSCFYLLVEQYNAQKELKKRFIAGNPQIKRKSVSGYRINSVLRDAAGKSLVFIIEKRITEKDGTSIRYMAETAAL